MRHAILLLLVPILPLAGCDWVDATGAQAGDAPPPVPVALDDFAPGEPVTLIERENPIRLVVGNEIDDGDVYTWTEEPLEQGALDTCASVEGFRPGLAATTLAEACSDADDCAFAFEPDTDDEGGIGFVVRSPVLRASVGLRHRLSVRTADGNTGGSIRDFCLVAVNEAPVAVDDGPFTVTEGTTFTVGGPGDPDNLLANDTDDDDVGNQGLVVLTTPASAPSESAAFELGSDGSFSYTFDESGIRGSFEDSFVYRITDGVHDPVEARVTLTIVPSDLPPRSDAPLQPVEALSGTALEVDVGAGFSDPEGETLRFALADPSSLPASGSLTLDPSGVLAGVPLDEDVGDYDVRFVASDGVRETEGRLALSIRLPPNEAPSYVRGSSDELVFVRRRRVSVLAARFEDPDGDTLRYELTGTLPRGLVFDETTGRITGIPLPLGLVLGFQVRAIDPSGAEAVSIVFSIRVVA